MRVQDLIGSEPAVSRLRTPCQQSREGTPPHGTVRFSGIERPGPFHPGPREAGLPVAPTCPRGRHPGTLCRGLPPRLPTPRATAGDDHRGLRPADRRPGGLPSLDAPAATRNTESPRRRNVSVSCRHRHPGHAARRQDTPERKTSESWRGRLTGSGPGTRRSPSPGTRTTVNGRRQGDAPSQGEFQMTPAPGDVPGSVPVCHTLGAQPRAASPVARQNDQCRCKYEQRDGHRSLENEAKAVIELH